MQSQDMMSGIVAMSRLLELLGNPEATKVQLTEFREAAEAVISAQGASVSMKEEALRKLDEAAAFRTEASNKLVEASKKLALAEETLRKANAASADTARHKQTADELNTKNLRLTEDLKVREANISAREAAAIRREREAEAAINDAGAVKIEYEARSAKLRAITGE